MKRAKTLDERIEELRKRAKQNEKLAYLFSTDSHNDNKTNVQNKKS